MSRINWDLMSADYIYRLYLAIGYKYSLYTSFEIVDTASVTSSINSVANTNNVKTNTKLIQLYDIKIVDNFDINLNINNNFIKPGKFIIDKLNNILYIKCLIGYIR